MNNSDKKITDAIRSASNGKISESALKKAQNGDLSEIMSTLNKSDAENLKAALSDSRKAKEILSSKQAKDLLNSLFGGK